MSIILFCAISMIVAAVVCVTAGRSRAWIAQYTFAIMVVNSLATASKIAELSTQHAVSVAVGVYSMTFLIANFLREMHGREAAVRAVIMGLLGELLFVLNSQLALIVNPASFWKGQEAFETVFGITPRIFIASVIAYICAEFSDIAVFQKIRNATNNRHLWLRNFAGTAVGQTIDSAIFYTIAFAGLVPNLGDLILVTCLTKYLIAAASTPVIYGVRYIVRAQGGGSAKAT